MSSHIPGCEVERRYSRERSQHGHRHGGVKGFGALVSKSAKLKAMICKREAGDGLSRNRMR